MFIDPEIRMILYKTEKRSLRKKRILGKRAKMIPRSVPQQRVESSNEAHSKDTVTCNFTRS